MSKFAVKRRILIVGEGRETEYNYFVGFRDAHDRELNATATTISVKRGKGGNARDIVEHAVKEAKKFDPNSKRGDRVFLVMDTEGVGRAPELHAAEQLAAKNRVEIVYSSPAIEYWLLCHFAKAPRGYFKDCAAVIAELDKRHRWPMVCKAKYLKGDQDIFERLSRLLNDAREQALQIDLHHLGSTGAARKTNPSTQVYELIAILIGASTGMKCPISGAWRLIGATCSTAELKKGDAMPPHDGTDAHWML